MNYDTILNAYLVCALWASCDEHGAPMDRDHDVRDFADKARDETRAEISDFCQANAADILLSLHTEEQLGHDFFLTRNGHGAGFWDRVSRNVCPAYEQEQAQKLSPHGLHMLAKNCQCQYHALLRLSDASKVYGSADPGTGDDGKLYF